MKSNFVKVTVKNALTTTTSPPDFETNVAYINLSRVVALSGRCNGSTEIFVEGSGGFFVVNRPVEEVYELFFGNEGEK